MVSTGRCGHRLFGMLVRVPKLLAMSIAVLLAGLALNTFAHVKLHFCACRFAPFARKDMRLVVYGYPMEATLERAKRGEIVLGGCMPGWSAAVCPYCHWTAAFARNTSSFPIEDKLLADLTASEKKNFERFMRMVLRQAPGLEEITALCITPQDVWVGTMATGLARMDRASGSGESFLSGPIGASVHSIRVRGDRVTIEHEMSLANRLVETEVTTDRGKTWTRETR